MSNIPDKYRRGFKSSRDTRESAEKNIRFKCPYCPRDKLLYTSYGLHIYKEHLDVIFLSDSKDCIDNRKTLQSKNSIKNPVALYGPKSDTSFWCFGCQTCFKNHTKAEKHLEKHKLCQEAHRENLFQLKDKYPIQTEVVKARGIPNKAKLEYFIGSLIERVRQLEYKHKEEKMDYEEGYTSYFEDWNMELREEELRKEWTFFLEEKPKEPTPPPTPPSEPEEDDLLPLVEEKSLSKEEVLRKVLDDPDIPEDAKRALQQDFYKNNPKPQTSAFPKAKRLPKQVDTPSPPTIIPPPPPVEDKKKSFEEQMAELDAEKKKTPWQRFLQANPGMSVQEQLQRASIMGIRPDNMGGGGFKIVGNTKRP
jgi:hypothetical protein